MNEPFRVVVLGAGPAGRIAAHRAAARGWDVVALDPAGGSMPTTVGAWAHQLPDWLPDDAVASRFRPTVITSGGRRRLLDDDYVVLDTAVLSGLGGFAVREEPGNGGSTMRFTWTGDDEEGAGDGHAAGGAVARFARIGERVTSALVRARELLRPDPAEGPGATVHHEYYDADDDDVPADFVDPNGPDGDFYEWTSPDVVIDAIGATPFSAVLDARQIARGHLFREEDIPERHRVPVLMDFRVPGGAGDEMADELADDASTGAPATFSYRLPLGDGTWLIEETILAARASSDPGDPRSAELHRHVRRRQAARVADLGIDPAAAIAVEIVDFPLGPWRLPDNRPRVALANRLTFIPLGRGGSVLDLSFLTRPFGGDGVPGYGHFGAMGGWMHPATGYSVGAVLSDVDRFLDRVGSRSDASPPGGRPLAWLRRRGLHVLLAFDDVRTRQFFDAFFTLPDAAIRESLTGTSAPRTLAVMARLLIPLARRSPAMLAKLLLTFADGKPVAEP
ncbi:lycopene cyclase family protein [Corynebacterium sp. HMSC11E11]|uniref:lycopene cyclase family protein n=1 Tax=Corynebacterium sp. HMSC11E11 TaxID=1581089 RepID=UPI000AF65EB6|nr:lycopene cyclase family protein [Corynebacterium sp. HMSC11E11]